MRLFEFHFHVAPNPDRNSDAAILKAVRELEEKTMSMFTELKTKTDALIAHVDAMDTQLQKVKTDLANFQANAGSLSASDAADLAAIIASIDTADTKVVADTA